MNILPRYFDQCIGYTMSKNGIEIFLGQDQSHLIHIVTQLIRKCWSSALNSREWFSINGAKIEEVKEKIYKCVSNSLFFCVRNEHMVNASYEIKSSHREDPI